MSTAFYQEPSASIPVYASCDILVVGGGAAGHAAALAAAGRNVFDTLQNNDAYHALQAVEGLIITGATGTNVNDVAVVLIGGEAQADA